MLKFENKFKKGLYTIKRVVYLYQLKTQTLNIMETTLAKNWNKLERSEKLEIIENAIDMCDTSEGFLMIRTYSKDNSISAHIQTKLDNHLCSEAVSQETLISLFGENYNFQEEDAETILTWMENINK